GSGGFVRETNGESWTCAPVLGWIAVAVVMVIRLRLVKWIMRSAPSRLRLSAMRLTPSRKRLESTRPSAGGRGHFEQTGHQGGPAGLVTGPQAVTVVAMKILVKKDQ